MRAQAAGKKCMTPKRFANPGRISGIQQAATTKTIGRMKAAELYRLCRDIDLSIEHVIVEEEPDQTDFTKIFRVTALWFAACHRF